MGMVRRKRRRKRRRSESRADDRGDADAFRMPE
jgi:hypothetical protein